ncbi:response regulator [Flavobacterium sp. LC2016-23]|uniref:sigma 54-interacting transcriptional regulator n=1 Tax=Flavobacterium sp. LC2016-23 TaxID=2666330 RepID=UPI0012AF99D7|nr:sigma 54-interacting transcriptional regulator [Flavobacterium sp. LC2016-23]MRX41535.1 response regulator [Flavobacterium sp. LC2016-23]
MSNKVLIVEDEFIVANDLRLTLKQAGYDVIGIAVSAEEADVFIKKSRPDLVLLDIRLEGKQSGIDLAKKLKDENIAFIFLSANSDQKILEQAKKTDPYGFLVKPFREKDLLIALEIASYRHQNSLESIVVQEALLQKKMKAIDTDTLKPEEYVLKIARILQPYIPFDLMVSQYDEQDHEHVNTSGYLRTGFDEYQFIAKEELVAITGLNSSSVTSMLKNSSIEKETIVYRNETLNEDAVLHFIKNHFKTESYLIFPFFINDQRKVRYLFCSRKQNNYSNFHTDLLNRLKTSFSALIKKSIANFESASFQNKAGHKTKENSKTENQLDFNTIIGKHPLLLEALDMVLKVSNYNTAVLILGESGTGKEKIAQSVHTLSMRKNGPFIKVNCAAIPSGLIESELFGHEKGAFTGALEKRKGKFELADGGTIFLDEIGELTLEMQVKLLRVLQEKEIDSIGGNTPKKVDIRIVAATNRNLEKEVATGRFRLDLYYRLNVFPITLPPLRERKTDINELALYFAKKFSSEFNKAFTGITAAMTEQLYHYHWPGNIRELENVIQRSVILNEGSSKLELKQNLSITSSEIATKKDIQNLEDVRNIQRETEREYIISVLKKVNGRIRGAAGAAVLLNIKPTTLESKMAKLQIKKEDFLK